MRLVVFTALERGVASIVVPRLAAAPQHELAGIVFSEMLLAGRRNWFERRVKKIDDHFDELARDAKPQGSGASYTTPSFRQYRRIVREHRAMAAQENGGAGGHR